MPICYINPVPSDFNPGDFLTAELYIEGDEAKQFKFDLEKGKIRNKHITDLLEYLSKIINTTVTLNSGSEGFGDSEIHIGQKIDFFEEISRKMQVEGSEKEQFKLDLQRGKIRNQHRIKFQIALSKILVNRTHETPASILRTLNSSN